MRILVATMLLAGLALPASGWSPGLAFRSPQDAKVSPAALPEWVPDPEIAAALKTIRGADLLETVRALVACGTRHSASDDGASDDGASEAAARRDGRALPTRGIGAARRLLVDRLRALSAKTGGRLEVHEEWIDLESRDRLPGGRARGANVIARLPGRSDPDRVIVVSGHYDSINSRYDQRRGGIDVEGDAPGADDDASGVAVVLACAAALAGLEMEATVEFAAFTAEEQGLHGSRAHAIALKSRGARVEVAITNDIVGASRGPDGVVRDGYVRLFSACPDGLDSPARNLARHAVEVARLHVAPFEPKLVFRPDRFGRGGDHTSFEAEGFPGLRFTEPREDYSHQHQTVREEGGVRYGDLPEHLDPEYLARVARLNAVLVAELARAPAPPEGVSVNGAMRSDTEVRWTPAEDGSVAGYEIVARDTTAPLWEHVFAAGPGPRGVAPVLLDDHVVGLRAVGKNGRRSPAVVPGAGGGRGRTR